MIRLKGTIVPQWRFYDSLLLEHKVIGLLPFKLCLASFAVESACCASSASEVVGSLA